MTADDVPPPNEINIAQDSLPIANDDLADLELPDIQQDLYVLGDVINEDGDLSIINNEGSINVTGAVRAANVNIVAARDFNLNTQDWLHTNRDPRQYIHFDTLRELARSGGTQTYVTAASVPGDLPAAIDQDRSRILALGQVAITARYLNINGLVQSGIDAIEIYLTEDFDPVRTTSLLYRYASPQNTELRVRFRSLPTISFGKRTTRIIGTSVRIKTISI